MKEIIIETKNLILRHFVIEDAKKVFVMSRELCMRRWIPDQVYGSMEEAVGVLRYLIAQYSGVPDPSKAPYVLGIALKPDGRLIGHAGLSPVREGAEIGYAIEEKEQSKGFATEAVTAFSRFAMDASGLQSVFGIVSAENIASCRVLEKSGFSLIEEKMRNAFGRYCLCRIYSLE